MERYYNFKYSFHLNNLFFLKNNPPSFLKNRFFDLKSMRETMRENFSSTSTELSACHLVQKGKKKKANTTSQHSLSFYYSLYSQVEVTIVSFVVSNLGNKFGFKREIVAPESAEKKSFLRVKKRDKAATVVFSVTWKSTWNRLDEFKGEKKLFIKRRERQREAFSFSSFFLLPPFFSFSFRIPIVLVLLVAKHCRRFLVPLIKLGKDGEKREKKTSKEKVCLDSRSIWNFQMLREFLTYLLIDFASIYNIE